MCRESEKRYRHGVAWKTVCSEWRIRADYSRAVVEFRKHLNSKTWVIYEGLRQKKITRLTKKQKREALREDALRQGDISILQNT
jgi:hypothetical protein